MLDARHVSVSLFGDGGPAVALPGCGGVGVDSGEVPAALLAVVVDRVRLDDVDLDGGFYAASCGHQLVAILTTVAGAGNPKPTRTLARTAMRSLEKYTEESASTVACSRITR